MKLKSIFARAGKLANLLIIAFLLLQLASPAVAQSRRRQAASGSPSKVIFASFDGLAYHMWQNDPVTRELHTIRRIAARGVTARGMIQSFPSITPAGHAALWTGVYGNVSGIITSWTPMLPRSEHTPFDLKLGFSAELLRAEPIWAAAARQGVKVVAHQATQNYPFVPITTAQGASLAPVLVSGYGPDEIETDASLRPKDVMIEDVNIWSGLPRSSIPIRAFRWKIKNVELHGALVAEVNAARGYTAMYVAADPRGPRVRVAPRATESRLPKSRPLARFFSDGLMIDAGEKKVPSMVYFRLFELSPDGKDFLLYQTSIHELAVYDGKPQSREFVEAVLKEAGGFIGNGGSYPYRRGELGIQVYKGGDGIAERRYLETMELIIRQFNRHTLWFWKKYSPQLMVDYCPYPDEMDHTFYGLARPDVTGVESSVAAIINEFRRWGYAAIETRAAMLDRLAGPGGYVVITSDHGMSPIKKEVRVNEILKRTGLLATTGEGSNEKIDPSRTEAVHLRMFITVNTEEWRGGIVPIAKRKEVVDRVEGALKQVRDPETGQPVFVKFFRPEQYQEEYGIGGPAGGDLYFELAPGYYINDYFGPDVITTPEAPHGSHGFVPTRHEMLASFIARGPRLPRGAKIPTIRSIQVAPFVSDLLRINPPAHTRARSPFAYEQKR